MPRPAPPLPPLLLRQHYILFWLCGLLAWRWPEAALLCAALLFLAAPRLRQPLPAVLGVAAVLAGWLVMRAAMPVAPAAAAIPAWTVQTTALPLHGDVIGTQGLPDGRLRVLLSDVRPAATVDAMPSPHVATTTAHALQAAPLPRLTVWTWDKPLFTPLEGQTIALTLPLHRVTGLDNTGMSDMALWWQRQGVFWQMWSRGDKGCPHIIDAGAVHAGALWRNAVREALFSALTAASTDAASPHRPFADTSFSPPAQHASPAQHTEPPRLTQGQAFLPALLLGDRSALATQTVHLMSAAALVHSLALSGQHLALACLLGTVLAWGLGWLRPQLYQRLPRSKWALLLSLPPALLYLWLGGAPASLWRACVMLAIFALYMLGNRSRTTLDILLGAVLAITLVHPAGVFDTGLQLSVLCVAVLGLSAPLLRRVPFPAVKHRTVAGILRRGGQIVLAALCLQLGLLPLTLLLFHTVSPWFVGNVFWLPVLGLWVMPLAALGTLAAVCGATALAQPLLWLATLPCDTLLDLLHAMHNGGLFDLPALLRPHWTVLPAWAALLAAGSFAIGRHPLPPVCKRLLLAVCVLLLVGPALRAADMFATDVRVQLLDVGQGQAVCLHLPYGQRLLIDAGGSYSSRFDTGRDVVSPTLAYNAAPRLWGVIATHPHIDHARGLDYITRTWRVEHPYHNDGKLVKKNTALLMPVWNRLRARGNALHAGDTLPLPSADVPLRLEVLHPPAHVPAGWKGNDRSLVLRLVCDTVSGGHTGLALIPGDVEEAALHTLLDSNADVQAEVLVLPHHGSRSSAPAALYDSVRPRLALASCGASNRFNYPSPEVRQALTARHIPLLTTAVCGGIDVRFFPGDDAPFRISTQRP